MKNHPRQSQHNLTKLVRSVAGKTTQVWYKTAKLTDFDPVLLGLDVEDADGVGLGKGVLLGQALGRQGQLQRRRRQARVQRNSCSCGLLEFLENIKLG